MKNSEKVGLKKFLFFFWTFFSQTKNFITGQNEREENTQDTIVTQKMLRTQAMRSTT
jgi:hypothetical protein